MDEEKVVRAAQKQEPQAFEQLYNMHFDRIYRYLYFKTGDREAAEDMTQEVFLKAWQSIGSYKIKGMPFSAWLFRIAHNLLVDHYRKKTRTKELPLEEAEAPWEQNPAAILEKDIRRKELAQACERLPVAQREVISLRFVAGLSTAEVAEAIGKKEGAVKALQHSALVSLRRSLAWK
ncbi:MAG: sigma-70 family RNA polymerase sigma factor [Chloroflexota bacterium]|nr:sigma-70 family RNA polymerase sigma factor [Chloroflexota bacterium]